MLDDDEYLLLEDEEIVQDTDKADADCDFVDLDIDDLKVGLNFASEAIAIKSIENWSYKTLCALAKIRYRKGKMVDGERVKGRRCLACPHGISRKKTGKGERPGQRVKDTNCPVKVNLNEQEDGSWEVTTCHLQHEGHPTTSKLFYSHQQSRKLEEDDKKFVKGLLRARANPRNIADVLTERTGKDFRAQDVRNLITKIKQHEDNPSTVEEALGEIRDGGGEVRYKKEKKNDNVDVLWVQTKDMKNQLSRTKPQVFECDTTFGTQAEGYKLYIPVFHSKFSDKWEVAGLLFLSTETKEKVEDGIKFFKESLPYRIVDGVNKFIFFTDKDFDYIEVNVLHILSYCGPLGDLISKKRFYIHSIYYFPCL